MLQLAQCFEGSAAKSLLVNYGWSLNIELCSLCILLYEHLATLPDEIQFVWRRKKNITSYLFLSTRYLALVGNIIFAAMMRYGYNRGICWKPPRRCEEFNLWGRKFLLGVLQFLVCLILLMRIIALYQPRRRWRFLMIAVLCSVYSASALTMFLLRPDPGEKPVCTIPSVSNSFGDKFFFLPWLFVFVVDVAVWTATVRKMYADEHLMYRPLLRRMSVDGSIYFAIMAGINMSNIITYIIGWEQGSAGMFAGLTSTISVAMAARLTLNLLKTFNSLGDCPSTFSQVELPEFSFPDPDPMLEKRTSMLDITGNKRMSILDIHAPGKRASTVSKDQLLRFRVGSMSLSSDDGTNSSDSETSDEESWRGWDEWESWRGSYMV